MPGLKLKKRVEYFDNDEQKAKFILETIDRLLPFFLEHDSFAINELYKNLEKDIPERRKYHTVTSHIESYLVDKKLLEKTPQNLHFKLTKEGRDAKRMGSLKKYEKSLRPKWASHQIVTVIIPAVLGSATLLLGFLTYRLNSEKSKLLKQNEDLKFKIENLNSKVKHLENKTTP